MAPTASPKPPLRGVAHLWRSESYGYRTPGSLGEGHGRGTPNYSIAISVGPAHARKDALAPDRSAAELLQICLATFSAAAGLIHLAAAFSHFDVSGLHSAFFVGTGVAQLAGAALFFYRPRSWVFASTAVGNSLILAIWAMSRTTGIPLEPESWTPEPVGIADAVASALELALVIGCAVLLVPSARSPLPSSSVDLRRWLVPAASVLVVLTGPALFFTGTGHIHETPAHGATEKHSHAEVDLVGGKAMAGATTRAGSLQLPATPPGQLSEPSVQTIPAPVVQPSPTMGVQNPPPVISLPVDVPVPEEQPPTQEGQEHQGHQ
jgi:hypothetical protein